MTDITDDKKGEYAGVHRVETVEEIEARRDRAFGARAVYFCEKTNDSCELEMKPGLRKGTFSGQCFCNSFSFYAKDDDEALERVAEYCPHIKEVSDEP